MAPPPSPTSPRSFAPASASAEHARARRRARGTTAASLRPPRSLPERRFRRRYNGGEGSARRVAAEARAEESVEGAVVVLPDARGGAADGAVLVAQHGMSRMQNPPRSHSSGSQRAPSDEHVPTRLGFALRRTQSALGQSAARRQPSWQRHETSQSGLQYSPAAVHTLHSATGATQRAIPRAPARDPVHWSPDGQSARRRGWDRTRTRLRGWTSRSRRPWRRRSLRCRRRGCARTPRGSTSHWRRTEVEPAPERPITASASDVGHDEGTSRECRPLVHDHTDSLRVDDSHAVDVRHHTHPGHSAAPPAG